MVELGPTDEGMKNGHLAKDCPNRTDIRSMNNPNPYWTHGCLPMKQIVHETEFTMKMSEEEFDLVNSHRDGLHNNDPEYACPLCLAETENYMYETLANLKKHFIPPFAEQQPEDARTIPLPSPFCRTCGDDIYQTTGPDGIWMHKDPENTCARVVK